MKGRAIPLHFGQTQIKMSQFSRFELLIGKDNLIKLSKFHVLVFGIGGVGGHVVDALARSGISHITIVDKDDVEETNINRQLVASYNTIGKAKVDVMKEHILSINPNAEVHAIKKFYLPENSKEFDFSKYDYIVDCVDNMSAKISIICEAKLVGTPVISALGAGNKLDPIKLEVSDLYKTSVDPLAKILRRELRKRNIDSLKVVYSKETPIEVESRTPASSAFVPSSMGLIIASEVIKDLLAK